MAATWTDVVNNALIKLGASPIIDVTNTGNSKGGKLAALKYQDARDVVLRLHPWNCATKEVSSANLTSPTPAFSYTYFHLLPADCLRLLSVGEGDIPYKIQGRYIATDETELQLTYIRQEDDVTVLDTLCREAIATYLAWDLCTALEQNGEIKDTLWKQFNQILPQAKSVDGKEEPAQEIEANYWIDSRLEGPGFDRSQNWAM